MKRLISGLAILFALGGAANAADYGAASAPAGYDWSGWYLGGYVAHVSGALTGDFTDPAISNIDGGAQLHYNMTVHNNWVLSPFIIVPVPGAIKETEFKVDWAVIGGVRLGYAHDRWLPYAFLGGEVAGVNAGGFGSNTHVGYLLGAGLEYALDDRWSIGARYTFISMGAQPYDFAGNVGWQGHSIAATLNFKLH